MGLTRAAGVAAVMRDRELLPFPQHFGDYLKNRAERDQDESRHGEVRLFQEVLDGGKLQLLVTCAA